MRSISTSNSTSKIAGLTLVNALIFQEVLADYEPRVQHLRQTLAAKDAISEFADHWDFILTNINYYPIFYVAHELALALSSNPDSENALRALAKYALEIVQQRAALRHDLMGRVYHRLLAEAKFLGTYYTSVPSATLLLKLALKPEKWRTNWGDATQISTFRVGDLACGTGTLLMASAEAITDNYLNACGVKHLAPDMSNLSRVLIEDTIYGYDVLLSALHLTASTLALRAPEVTFKLMHLWMMPMESKHRRLGSIEFLKGLGGVAIATDLFQASTGPDQVTSTGDRRRKQAYLPDLDLCVMNPPFTRSVGGNLLFGSLEDADRRILQSELSKLLKRPHVNASSTAGLGSVFVATGDLHLKAGGRMALVLPKALLSGVAWEKTRFLFRLRYQLECIVASHDPNRWNFSENTDLSEVLIIGRKVDDPHKAAPSVGNVVCLNLWKNPTTIVEALNMAHLLNNATPPDVSTDQGAHEMILGEAKFGEAVVVPWADIRDGSWMPPCAFAQSELLRAGHHVMKGNLYLPGAGIVGSIPTRPLGQLGSFGPDRRRIVDAFQGRRSKSLTPYAAFWGHDSATMTTMAQKANAYLSALPHPKGGHAPGYANVLWCRAGNILLAERMRLNTQRLVSVRLDAKVLSNVWWPFRLLEDDIELEKALTLWLNSTPGLIGRLATREETEGAWVGFKQPTLERMAVLDISALTLAQKRSLALAYDQLSSQPLLPLPEMAGDATRVAIDAAVAQTLGLPDFSVLRKLLAQEPVVCLQPLR